MLISPDVAMPFSSLGEVRERLLRPAVGFHDPDDVVKDGLLDPAEKRAILSSWASDACAVQDRPHLRWPLGVEAPIPLDAVLEAMSRLDRLENHRTRA
ncbi:MAG: hypothetical protein WA840_00250 [Caulobacteraceae bacterium]